MITGCYFFCLSFSSFSVGLVLSLSRLKELEKKDFLVILQIFLVTFRPNLKLICTGWYGIEAEPSLKLLSVHPSRINTWAQSELLEWWAVHFWIVCNSDLAVLMNTSCHTDQKQVHKRSAAHGPDGNKWCMKSMHDIYFPEKWYQTEVFTDRFKTSFSAIKGLLTKLHPGTCQGWSQWVCK